MYTKPTNKYISMYIIQKPQRKHLNISTHTRMDNNDCREGKNITNSKNKNI